jgi:hypothetical protein
MFDQQTGEEQRVCGGTQFLELSSVYNTVVGRSLGKVYYLLGRLYILRAAVFQLKAVCVMWLMLVAM